MMDAGLATILFVLMLSVTAVQSQITKGPVNALKKVGDSVTLECVTSSNNCDGVEWKKMEGAQSPLTVYRDGTGMINNNVFPLQRYSVSSTGGCSLTITQLNISDSGRFSCVLTVDGAEQIKSSILVVIGVKESCRSNVTSNALSQNDSYSFWTVINVPAKSVEPSNVTLSFQDKTVGETDTQGSNQSQTVNATLTGIARKENITSRVCRASLPPNTAANFDGTTATLDVCTTEQLIVSYPVENIAVSPTGPYYKDSRVTCTADGQPPPTFKWTHLKSGDVADGDTLVITGEAGDKYSCTAMNTIKGKDESQSVTIEVSSDPSCGSGCSASIIIIIMFIIIIAVVIWLVGWKLGLWPLRFRLPYFSKKDDKTSEKATAGEPLPDLMPTIEPAKPPRANDPTPNRPRSECTYAELQFEPKPQQIKPNIVNDSSTDYACVAIA